MSKKIPNDSYTQYEKHIGRGHLPDIVCKCGQFIMLIPGMASFMCKVCNRHYRISTIVEMDESAVRLKHG